MTYAQALEGLRAICLALPEASERPSHGHPTFFVRGKRSFLMLLDDHHGDGRLAVWCAAGAGVQQLLVGADPERFFVPPYVGHRGWLGVRLDRGADWDELAGLAEDAYAEVAPPALLQRAVETGGREGRMAGNIRGRHGFDVVGSPAELQAEVSGRPRKTTGNQR